MTPHLHPAIQARYVAVVGHADSLPSRDAAPKGNHRHRLACACGTAFPCRYGKPMQLVPDYLSPWLSANVTRTVQPVPRYKDGKGGVDLPLSSLCRKRCMRCESPTLPRP